MVVKEVWKMDIMREMLDIGALALSLFMFWYSCGAFFKPSPEAAVVSNESCPSQSSVFFFSNYAATTMLCSGKADASWLDIHVKYHFNSMR